MPSRWKLSFALVPLVCVSLACSGCSQNNNNNNNNNGTQGASYFLPNKPQGTLVTNRLPQVAVDATGGVHVVYAANGVDGTGRRPAYYGHCPSNCDNPGKFSVVQLSDVLGVGQIALDPQGRPRILLAVGPDPNNNVQYQYWACDANCTQAASWSGTAVVTAQASFTPSPTERRQSFALDSQGRPRFIYFANPFGATGLTGNVYAHCDAGCGDASNWRLTKLSDIEWRNTALAFTPAGLPRVVFSAKKPTPDYEPLLNYFECDKPDCSGTNSGQTLLVTTTAGPNSDSVFALRLTSSGNPRLLLYPGTGSGGDLRPNRLYYLACEGNCTSRDRWTVMDIGAGDTHGEGGIDLALDKQNRPRIAYRVPAPTNELLQAACNSGCESSPQDWKGGLVPATAAAEQELGLPPRQGCPDCSPPIPPCPSAFYDSGYWPSIALDPSGNPRIAFEVHLQQGGGRCSAGVLARLSRLAVLAQP